MSNKEKRISARTTKEFHKKYLFYCKKYNYVPAKRLRVLMEKDLRGEIK